MLGEKTLKRLRKARVAVFGLGAVGSFAAEAMARSGVSQFVLVDFDRVRYSNFNRQLLALESTVGKLKVELQRKRILEINPRCEVKAFSVFAQPKNFGVLLTPRPDVVIDAIDSLGPKVALIAYCLSEKIPLVSSLGSGAKTDPFSVTAGDISEVRNCALGRRVRKELRRKKNIFEGFCCVYSTQPPLKSCPAKKEKEFYKRGRERSPVGTVSYMAGIFGLVAAYEAMRIIAGGLDGEVQEAG